LQGIKLLSESDPQQYWSAVNIQTHSPSYHDNKIKVAQNYKEKPLTHDT